MDKAEKKGKEEGGFEEETMEVINLNVIEQDSLMDKAKQKGKEIFPGGATRNNDIYDIAWNLMPWDGIREIAKIFAEGSGSHGPRNWENGQDPESTFNHLLDHLFRWWHGERGGKENHLAKAGWGIVTLLAFEVRGMLDKDNTMHYKVDPK